MCSGKITKVYHENEGIRAYKFCQHNSWSLDLEQEPTDVWLQSVPRIIHTGGGNGVKLAYQSKITLTKSVYAYLKGEYSWADWDIFSYLEERGESPDVMLSGFYAYTTLKALFANMIIADWCKVYRVKLRGIIYESDANEISGSEMLIEDSQTYDR
jgi:hypothetical protein